MRPGIAGVWHVHSRQETLFDKWVEEDLLTSPTAGPCALGLQFLFAPPRSP